MYQNFVILFATSRQPLQAIMKIKNYRKAPLYRGYTNMWNYLIDNVPPRENLFNKSKSFNKAKSTYNTHTGVQNVNF